MDKIIGTLKSEQNRTVQIEEVLAGMHREWPTFILRSAAGLTIFTHQPNLYMHYLEEKHVNLHVKLIAWIRAFLKAIETLTRCYLPMELFPLSRLHNVTQAALKLVQKENPDYVLAIRNLSDYYDKKLVTFAVDRDGDLVIVFPAFVQLFNRLPVSLYELETVKVPIFDRNSKADSYSEIQTSKSYIAFNKDYYIQLRIQELRQCKLIHQTYFCEELFLVKH